MLKREQNPASTPKTKVKKIEKNQEQVPQTVSPMLIAKTKTQTKTNLSWVAPEVPQDGIRKWIKSSWSWPESAKLTGRKLPRGLTLDALPLTF